MDSSTNPLISIKITKKSAAPMIRLIEVGRNTSAPSNLPLVNRALLCYLTPSNLPKIT